ncbi:MAG: hypothetical protein IIT36_02625 [Aeriscardovia sp.]|nr:hypothetical protein [Aeriscardovia sp.]
MVNEKLRNLIEEQLETLASDGTTDPELLAALADEGAGGVRGLVALNPRRPPKC